ncbi:MAG TPA: DNA replication and repair protein RecF [Bacteroidia bacterium]|nr:DNA replication and repair protein RecF [Bacteroidia bacterium]HNT80276.1 DNA replication and repair protein RecF [Bacteroidia bacterium]
MYIRDLSIFQFKNYEEAQFEFNSGVNILFGPNGAGKTNVIDAIHYLSMCKSYFNPVDSQNIKHQSDFFMVSGNFCKKELEHKINCSFKNGTKVFSLNGNNYSRLSDHIGLFPVVVIAPSDQNLLTEGSEIRRKFIDVILSQYSKEYLQDLMLYNKIISQRNALLKQKGNPRSLDEQLEMYDEMLEEPATRVYDFRRDFIDQFNPYFNPMYQFLCDGKEAVEIQYESALQSSKWKDLMLQSRSKDKIVQFTSQGVHKDDLKIILNGHNARKYASQGQQKSVVIAMKLAQYEWLRKVKNDQPILLYDDIYDKLDSNRMDKLLQLTKEKRFGQIFISDTDGFRLSAVFDRMEISYDMFNIRERIIMNEKV